VIHETFQDDRVFAVAGDGQAFHSGRQEVGDGGQAMQPIQNPLALRSKKPMVPRTNFQVGVVSNEAAG